MGRFSLRAMACWVRAGLGWDVLDSSRAFLLLSSWKRTTPASESFPNNRFLEEPERWSTTRV